MKLLFFYLHVLFSLLLLFSCDLVVSPVVFVGSSVLEKSATLIETLRRRVFACCGLEKKNTKWTDFVSVLDSNNILNIFLVKIGSQKKKQERFRRTSSHKLKNFAFKCYDNFIIYFYRNSESSTLRSFDVNL